VNFSDSPPDLTPPGRLSTSLAVRQITLRHFIVAVVAFGMGMFTWHRTGGDMLLSAVIAAMTVAVVDIRVSDARSR
jgi:hypothetical protein